MKEARRYSSGQERASGDEAALRERPHPLFGLTLVTCERADIRQSPNGLLVYDDAGRREIPAPREVRGEAKFEEPYQAVLNDRPMLHHGRWGLATQKVALAILQSARGGTEVLLSRQTAVPVRRRTVIPTS